MDELNQLRATLPELGTMLGALFATIFLAFVRQGMNSIRGYLANKRINEGAENIVKEMLYERPDIPMDALIEGALSELKGSFEDSIGYLRATDIRLRRIIRSKVVDQASMAAKIAAEAKPC